MIGIVFACALCFGIGCSGLVMPRRPPAGVPGFSPLPKGSNRLISRPIPRVTVRRLVVGALVGLGSALATGWPAALLVGGLAGYGLPGLFARTSGGIAIGTIEAIATWTEMLQGTLASSAGMSQAIAITAPLAPLIRPGIRGGS